MKVEHVNRALIITTGSGYSEPAIELGQNNNIILLDLVQFLAMKKEEFIEALN